VKQAQWSDKTTHKDSNPCVSFTEAKQLSVNTINDITIDYTGFTMSQTQLH